MFAFYVSFLCFSLQDADFHINCSVVGLSDPSDNHIILYGRENIMGKKATKAADNMYYIARSEAAMTNDELTSREKAAEIIGIDRTRLARIELDTITPYPEEVKAMAKVYNTPELCNSYCARECQIGRDSVTEVTIDDFDRLALKVLGSLKDIDGLRASLIAISEDGIIDESEQASFQEILDSLDKISTNATALKLWAQKNIRVKSKQGSN